MTVVPFPRATRSRPESKTRVSDWLGMHKTSLLVMLPVLALVAVAMTINFDGFPGRVNDDEGTYVAQTWAVLAKGQLSHYTYWYDHPPLGWLQIAAYAWATDGFHRAATAVTVGREFMVLTHLASCGLLYMLARRLQFSRVAGVAAVLLFTFSPVALYYHRMVFLDNIAIAWTLAALVFAASPRRSLAAAFGSGVCLAVAVLSKETTLVLLPMVAWVLFRNQPKFGRVWSMTLFGVTFASLASFYPLYAILKNELVPGPGHVSLVWAIEWQLFTREGSGSVLDPGSISYQTVHGWLQTDPWLLAAGAAAVIPALLVRRLWPLAFGMGFQVLMLFRSGYLPQAYLVALLPLAPLLVVGVGEAAFKARPFRPVVSWPGKLCAQLVYGLKWSTARIGIVLTVVAVVVFGALGGPHWADALRHSETSDPGVSSIQATNWLEAHAEKRDIIVTDDNLWINLTLDGYTKPIWVFKADLDPAVKAMYLSDGWRDIKYLVLPGLSESLLKNLPTVWAAIQHSHVVKVFGTGDAEMIVRVVDR